MTCKMCFVYVYKDKAQPKASVILYNTWQCIFCMLALMKLYFPDYVQPNAGSVGFVCVQMKDDL